VENSFGCVTTHASLVPICKAKFGLMRTRTLIIYRSIFSKDSTAHLTAIHQYSESHRTVLRTCFKCSDTLSYITLPHLSKCFVQTSFKMFCSYGAGLAWVNCDDLFNKALVTALINIQNDISKLNGQLAC
jgi:hypothetical protein